MANDQSGDIGSFLAGFIIGGLVGAAAALILAPQSGEEMRHRIAEQSAHMREAGTERMHAARDSAEHYMADARERAVHLEEQARIVLDEGKAKIGLSQDTPPDTVEEDTTGGDEPEEAA